MNYIQYLKDNPKRYWFKRKLYGWGWVPVRWQGWLVILAFIVFIAFIVKFFLEEGKILEYFVLLVIAIGVMISIAYKTGEKPRWSWGK